jgi:hypothetical protein
LVRKVGAVPEGRWAVRKVVPYEGVPHEGSPLGPYEGVPLGPYEGVPLGPYEGSPLGPYEGCR